MSESLVVRDIVDYTDHQWGQGYLIRMHPWQTDSYDSATVFIPAEIAEKWVRRLTLRVLA